MDDFSSSYSPYPPTPLLRRTMTLTDSRTPSPEDDWRKDITSTPPPGPGLPPGLSAFSSGSSGSSGSTVTTTPYSSTGSGSVWGTPTTSLSGSPPTSTLPSNPWSTNLVLQRHALHSTSTPSTTMIGPPLPIRPIGRIHPPKPNPSHPPFPPAIATIILPALVPRLTLLLPLVEVNIFLQVSKRHLASMTQSRALKALAVRQPRDSNNNNNKDGGGGAKQEEKEGGVKEGKDGIPATTAAAAPTATTGTLASSSSNSRTKQHPLLSLLSRYQKGLQSLRVADLRVFPVTLYAMHQGLLPLLTHLSLTNLNLPDDELARLSSLLGTPQVNTNPDTPSLPPALLLLHLETLDLSGNRFGDAGLVNFAEQLIGRGGLPRLTTLDLGGNGLTHSGHALLALAAAFEARGRGGGKEGGMGGQGHGTCVGLKKLVLGAWVWDRVSPFAVSHASRQQQQQQQKRPFSPLLPSIHHHPLHRLLLCLTPTLEELDLSHASLLPDELHALAEAWRRAPLPSLQPSLFSPPPPPPRVPLRVLRLGLAHRPTLDGSNTTNSNDEDKEEEKKKKEDAGEEGTEGGLISVMSAFKDGLTPSLHTLDLSRGHLRGLPILSLAEALQLNALPLLRHLRLAHVNLTSHNFSRLVRAIRTANPPFLPPFLPPSCNGLPLESLLLEGNPLLGEAGVQALALYLREGGLASLRTLNLNGSKCADHGLRELSRVLDGGAPVARSLQHLHLNDCLLTGEGVAWLGGTLARGSLSKLESLSLARNEGVGEEGVRYLVRFLKEIGGGCKLKTIDLRWINMGVGGAEALIQALEEGSCPDLTLVVLAQGGLQGMSWSLETRKSLHRVREVLLARVLGGVGGGKEGGREGGKALVAGAGGWAGGKKGGRERGVGVLRAERMSRRQQQQMQQHAGLPRVVCI